MTGILLSAIVVLSNACGRVEIETKGARVLSYVPANGDEVIFNSACTNGPHAWLHGGIPICWPWFNDLGDPGTEKHGFVRLRDWKLASRRDGDRESYVRFTLEKPGAWALAYEVTLTRTLALNLTMRNTGPERFVVTTGLHPYFTASHPTNVVVTTPAGEIRCVGGMDGARPFGEGTYDVLDYGLGRRLTLGMTGNTKLVVWNDGPQEKPTPGLEPDDWMHYICVEPAVIPRRCGFYLNPGEKRDIGLTCAVYRMGR